MVDMPVSLAAWLCCPSRFEGRGICDGELEKGTWPRDFGVPRYVPVADMLARFCCRCVRYSSVGRRGRCEKHQRQPGAATERRLEERKGRGQSAVAGKKSGPKKQARLGGTDLGDVNDARALGVC